MSDLIERLEERAAKCDSTRDTVYLRKAIARIKELEEALKAPLPGEVAGLIEHAAQWRHVVIRKEMSGIFPQTGLPAFIEKAASALEQQAREIERLGGMLHESHDKWERCLDRIAELEEALKAPLPDEVEKLAAFLRGPSFNAKMFEKAAAALERQAREIAELKSNVLDKAKHIAEQASRIKELEAELAMTHGLAQTYIQQRTTVEAERDRLSAELRVVYKLPLAMGHPVAQKLEAERDAAIAREHRLEEEITNVHRQADAIEAATIEECLAAIRDFMPEEAISEAGNIIRETCLDLIEIVSEMQSIRALAKPAEKEGK